MLKNFFIIFLKFNFFMLVLYIPFVEVTFKSFEIIYLNRQFLLINVLNVFFQLFLRIPLISLNDAWRLETFIIALQICYVIVFLYLIICGIVFAFFFFFAVFLSVTKFSQDWIINFLLVLYMMIADQISSDWRSQIFEEKILQVEFEPNGPKLDQKLGFLPFLKLVHQSTLKLHTVIVCNNAQYLVEVKTRKKIIWGPNWGQNGPKWAPKLDFFSFS